MIGTFADAVRMEAVRLRTVRSTYVLIAVAAGLGALVASLMALLTPAGAMSGENTTTILTDGGDVAPLSLAGVVVALLAVTTVSHDYRYRLVRAVLIAQPRRGVMIAARLVVLSVTGAGVAALTSVLAAAGCLAAGRRPLLDMTTLRVLLFHAGVVVGWAWLAAGLTWLLRHAAGVVTILLTGPLAVEPVLLIASRSDQAAFLRPLTGWLPFSAARQALGRNLTADALPGAVPDGAGRAALIFTVVVLAVAGTASLAVCRRDA